MSRRPRPFVAALAVAMACTGPSCKKLEQWTSPGSASPADEVALADSPWSDSAAMKSPVDEVADGMLADSAGGILVLGRLVKGATSVTWLRRYAADGRLDRRFSTNSIRQSAVHGFRAMHAEQGAPAGETLFVTADLDRLAVSPGGDWRRLPPAAPPPSSAPWLQIHGNELLLLRSRSGDVIAPVPLGSTLRPEESVELLGARWNKDFPVDHGTAYLAIVQGSAKDQQWRSSVGADDFDILPPAQKAAAYRNAPPPSPPSATGVVQVVVPPQGTPRVRRVSLQARSPGSPPDGAGAVVDDFSPGDALQSAQGDLALLLDATQLHQAGPRWTAVYWVVAPAQGAPVDPLPPLVVFPESPWIAHFTFFAPGTDDASLHFTVVDQDVLRIFVARRGRAMVAKEVRVHLGGKELAWTFVTDHKLAWYTNETPGQIAGSRVTVTEF